MAEKLKIAINGFGRIGRTFFRSAIERDLDIVAINDLMPTDQCAYLLKYDSVYGKFEGDIEESSKGLTVNGKLIPKLEEKDPAKLPWKDLAVDIAIESTGFFTDPKKAQAHIEAGAKQVIISAPCDGGVKTIIFGVNESEYKPGKDQIISFASCTTNCIAPVVKVLDEQFGIEKSILTTAHSYTSSQSLQDGPNKDFRKGRSAGINLVPTTTGASKATELAYPNIQGKIDGMALRVPTPTVSIVDYVALLKQDATPDEINHAFETASKQKSYQGAIGTTKEPVVSTDLKADPHAAIVDLSLTKVVDGNLVKVIAWYDNEMGYSIRLVEFCKYLDEKITLI